MNARWTIFALTVCVVHGGAYTIPVSAAREPHTRNANRLAVPRALLPAKSEVPSVNLKGATKFKIFRGDFVHCRDFEELEFLMDHVVLVEDGKIASVLAATPGNLTALKSKHGFSDAQLKRHVDGFRFWLPGFLDTHVHYSQLWNRGLGTDEPLLPWLQKYTFPLEDFFVNSGRMDKPTYDAFVDIAYTRAIQHYLSMGVTSAMIYATSDTNSTLRLAELCAHYNQRCFVGKVNMDLDDGRGEKFNIYETLEEGYSETVRFIDEMQKQPGVQSGLITPVITPRFAPACSTEMLRRLGALAKERNLLIQTHMSENKDEIAEVEARFNKTYPEVYRDVGLLTDRSVLAHCVHLNQSQLDMVKESGATCSHCPLSNFQLNSGIAPIWWYKSQGYNNLGLGSDVAGGYAVSMLEVMKGAILGSKSLAFAVEDWKPLNYKNVLYMATIGGANALKLAGKVGKFEVGYEFDAQMIDPYGDVTSPLDSEMDMDILDVTKHSSLREDLQKFIMTGDNRNVVKVFVKGELSVPFRGPPQWRAPHRVKELLKGSRASINNKKESYSKSSALACNRRCAEEL